MISVLLCFAAISHARVEQVGCKLDEDGDCGYRQPAAEAEENGLAAVFYEAHDICIEPDRRHCHGDEELCKPLHCGHERAAVEADKSAFRQKSHAGGNERRKHEPHDEKRERFLEREGVFGVSARLFRLCGAPQGENQGDGNDGERAGELNGDGGG